MTNIAKYRQPKLFLKILVMFFRQKYEEYSSVTFIRKNKTARDLLLEIRDSTSFLNVLIPPYLFQLHRKHKSNSILIQNICTFAGKYCTSAYYLVIRFQTHFQLVLYCNSIIFLITSIANQKSEYFYEDYFHTFIQTQQSDPTELKNTLKKRKQIREKFREIY